jgi:DnaJ-class molecular chaperone
MTNSECLYARLNLYPSASQADIKRAFREACKTHHPDLGGDPEEFAAIKEAADILTDSDKKAEYDATGSIGASKDPKAAALEKVAILTAEWCGQNPATVQGQGFLVFCEDLTEEAIVAMESLISDCEERKVSIQRFSNKLDWQGGGDSPAHNQIKKELKAINEQISEHNFELKVAVEVLGILAEYALGVVDEIGLEKVQIEEKSKK